MRWRQRENPSAMATAMTAIVLFWECPNVCWSELYIFILKNYSGVRGFVPHWPGCGPMVNSIVPPRFNSRYGKNGKSRLLPFSLTDWTRIFFVRNIFQPSS